MNNPKAQQTLYDLEIARCNEKWIDIPELAKRYKKYHPYESVLEFTARMEAEFILLVRQIRQEKYQSIDINALNNSNKSQPDLTTLPPSSPASPAPSTNSNGARKWGNRQLVSNISSTSNLNTVGNTTMVRKNYPEESDFIHQLDDPNHVSISYRLLPSQVQLLLVRLLDVIQRQIKSGELETPDDWQAQFSKIVLARMYFETERYDKTLEWLQHLALRLEDVETGYGLVLLVQARVMKGICYEYQENDLDALDSYLSALNVAEQHPQEQNKALFYWIEDGLYRAILLQLRKKGPVKQTLKLMRTYLHYCSTQWPTDWRIHKRWVIFRHYIRYLTRAYQKGVYVPATPQDEYTVPLSPTRSVFSDAGESTLFERSVAALDETIQLMTQFRSLLATFVPLLHHTNPIELSHRTLELSNLLVSAHETVGWGPIDYVQRTLKYLNRTRKFTFNSLCTTRHIFYTLIRLGETKEAKLALSYYLELLGVQALDDIQSENEEQLDELIETIQNRLEYITEQSLASSNKHIWETELKLKKLSITTEEDSEDEQEEDLSRISIPKKKSPTGSCESDTEFDVVRLILHATQHLYAQQGKQATILSDITISLLEESEILKRKKGSQWKSLMATSKRLRGVSYAIYASQCDEPEKRSEYLTESLLSLKRSTEMDTRSWQGFYHLALQQCMMGDMIHATESVQRSIKLRGDFIPSWHLLALIQSSRQFHALPKCLQIIQAGLAYHINMVDNVDNEDIAEFTLDTEEGQEFFDRAEAFIQLRMTQAKLLEILEGPEAMLVVYPDLFDMYAKLSKKMNLPVTIIEKIIAEPMTRKSSVVHESSIKSTRPRSRTNSSVHSYSSFTLDENESLDSLLIEDQSTPTTNTNILRKVQEVEDEEEEEDFVPDNNDPYKLKQRKSINLSKQLMDDPLMSFPVHYKKKEKKEKKDNNKSTTKRSNFLSLKPSFKSNHNSADNKKDLSSSSHQQDVSVSKENSSSSMMTRQPSIIKSSASTSALSQQLLQQQSSTYSSLLNKESSSVNLTATQQKYLERNNYYNKRHLRWQDILVQIWIMTSATYAKTHRFEDAYKAISEADQLTFGLNADVWHQLGLIILQEQQQEGKNNKIHQEKDDASSYRNRALDAFKRALSIDPHHIPTHLSLASVYLNIHQIELAEQLLEKSTKGLGWNRTEAWYMLGQVYHHQENLQDAKHSLLYALQLSDTNPILPLQGLLPNFV